ncbi:hypothetical protein K1719_002612 [Acacia pycnantha]|nr:hypothetical protein K1719_002612 [Acacia pycnantha]
MERSSIMDPAGMDVNAELQVTALSLYHSTQQGHWEEALTTFKNNPGIHELPINSSGDTLLHVALNDYKDDRAEEIVDEIKKKQSWWVLETKNDRGDTPLHCAASIGSLKMCKAIAEAQGGGDNQLMIEARNKEGETPLFLAALHGHNDAFLYLHFRCPHQSRPWKRTSDGETVLHCTISREHFDLAFQIILLYKDDIVGSVNEKGITPLHILASKPSAFESSSNFRWYNKLVYNCLIVKPLMGSSEQQSNNNDTFPYWWIKSSQHTQSGADAENPGYVGYSNVAPPNYWTCYDILVCLFFCFIQPVLKTIGYRGFEEEETKAHFPKPAGHHQIDAIQDEKNEENKKGYVDHNKSKELGELLTSLFKGKTSVSASKALTGCCICLGNGEEKEESDKKESAFFIAAKNGVLEMLEKIMNDKPGAIHETNSQGQNVLQVAVECRQPHVFNLFKQRLGEERIWNALVQNVDIEGNTILHLAAKLSQYKPWHIPGAALQMQWEIKWFMYIKDKMPPYVLFLPNKHDKSPVDLFREDHENLVKEGTEWLNHTSASCSVVAGLIAGVAFATSTTIPGGTQEGSGKPYLQRYPAFNMFALTSLLALCCSITSLTMFLAILTSRQQPRDFRKDLPLKLLFGLSSLFISISSILVSFSAAFFFVLKDSLKEVIFPLYAATILPLTIYVVAQFPLYADLVRAIFSKVPQASNRESEKLIL